MNFTNTTIYENNTIKLQVSSTLNKTNRSISLPERLVTFTSNNGIFTPETTLFTKETNTKFTGDRSILKAIIDNQELTIDLTKTKININESKINTSYSENPIVNAIITTLDEQKVTTGNITFTINHINGTKKEYTTILNNTNIAKLNITDITSYITGTYHITVKYKSTNNSYTDSENNTIKQWTITKANTTTNITSIDNNKPDELVITTNTVLINDQEYLLNEGNVTISLNSTPFKTVGIQDGKGLLNISGYTPGLYNISLVYSGISDKCNPSSASIILYIGKLDTSLKLAIQPLIISPTRTMKITPNLTPAEATGNIEYY